MAGRRLLRATVLTAVTIVPLAFGKRYVRLPRHAYRLFIYFHLCRVRARGGVR